MASSAPPNDDGSNSGGGSNSGSRRSNVNTCKECGAEVMDSKRLTCSHCGENLINNNNNNSASGNRNQSSNQSNNQNIHSSGRIDGRSVFLGLGSEQGLGLGVGHGHGGASSVRSNRDITGGGEYEHEVNFEGGMPIMEGLFDILGDEFRSFFESFMQDAAPARQVSKEFVANIGVCEVDSRKSILLDCFIEIESTIKIPAVVAVFGQHLQETIVSGSLHLADPLHAEAPLTFNPRLADSSSAAPYPPPHDAAQNNLIVLANRGKVSFVQKALNAQRSGAKILLVSQTTDMWPFVMTDSSGECAAPGNELLIPAVMISKKESEVLMQMVAKCKARGKGALSVSVCFKSYQSECPICQEDMCELQKVMRLPCRHCYHDACISKWLDSHSNCPLCRLELPSQPQPKAKPQSTNTGGGGRSASQTDQPYFY